MDILLWAPVLLFSVVAHERAHATAAYRQGDNTAYLLGRTTWNPLKHIDPIMSLAFPALLWFTTGRIFGAAKPVPVNPQNYRNYRRGDIIVSLAGIATNLIIFLACIGLYILVGVAGSVLPGAVHVAQQVLYFGMSMNLLLAFFNLIPIPPLDGSHVLYHLLPSELGLQYRRLYRLGYLPVMAVVFLVPGALNVLLWPADQLMSLANVLIQGFTVGGAIA